MLRALTVKTNSVQEQMGDVSRDVGILRKTRKEMQGMKNTHKNKDRP